MEILTQVFLRECCFYCYIQVFLTTKSISLVAHVEKIGPDFARFADSVAEFGISLWQK